MTSISVRCVIFKDLLQFANSIDDLLEYSFTYETGIYCVYRPDNKTLYLRISTEYNYPIPITDKVLSELENLISNKSTFSNYSKYYWYAYVPTEYLHVITKQGNCNFKEEVLNRIKLVHDKLPTTPNSLELDSLLVEPIVHKGISYKSVEHYYQAMKTTDLDIRLFLSGCITKQQLREYWIEHVDGIRKDFKEIRDKVLYKALWFKFNNPKNTKHSNELINTYPTPLILYSDNNPISLLDYSTASKYKAPWHSIDSSSLRGNNMVGKIHMNIRHKLHSQIPF